MLIIIFTLYFYNKNNDNKNQLEISKCKIISLKSDSASHEITNSRFKDTIHSEISDNS